MPPARKKAARSSSGKPKELPTKAAPKDVSDASSSSDELLEEETAPKKAKMDVPEAEDNSKCVHRVADMDGQSCWALDKKSRFVTISEFKGSEYINIREYYQKGGEGKMLPGKKGIALSRAQFAVLSECMADINEVLQSKK